MASSTLLPVASVYRPGAHNRPFYVHHKHRCAACLGCIGENWIGVVDWINLTRRITVIAIAITLQPPNKMGIL